MVRIITYTRGISTAIVTIFFWIFFGLVFLKFKINGGRIRRCGDLASGVF